MIPVQLSFKDIPPSDAVRRRIYERVERLERFGHRLNSIEVMIMCPRKRQNQCINFVIDILLDLPGKNLVISHKPGREEEKVDIYVSIRDAFDALERQLKEHFRKLRGQTREDRIPLKKPASFRRKSKHEKSVQPPEEISPA